MSETTDTRADALRAVSRAAARARQIPRHQGIRTDEVLTAVRAAVEAGCTHRDVADAARVSERTIGRWLHTPTGEES